MTRRGLAGLSVSALALAACKTGTGGTVTVTVAQVQDFLGSALSIVNALDKAFAMIGPVMKPADVASVTSNLALARTTITGLQTQLAGVTSLDTSTLAAKLTTIDNALNAVVSVAASLPVIPPPYSVAVQAAAVLLAASSRNPVRATPGRRCAAPRTIFPAPARNAQAMPATSRKGAARIRINMA
jgi:hypothetical protein